LVPCNRVADVSGEETEFGWHKPEITVFWHIVFGGQTTDAFCGSPLDLTQFTFRFLCRMADDSTMHESRSADSWKDVDEYKSGHSRAKDKQNRPSALLTPRQELLAGLRSAADVIQTHADPGRVANAFCDFSRHSDSHEIARRLSSVLVPMMTCGWRSLHLCRPMPTPHLSLQDSTG
jgi:hypothetical protein